MSQQEEGLKEKEGKVKYELDFGFIRDMAIRTTRNKAKYPPYNWKKPIDVEDLKQALFRHTIEVMEGNYEDDGSPTGHLEAIALNAMMIYYQIKNSIMVPSNEIVVGPTCQKCDSGILVCEDPSKVLISDPPKREFKCIECGAIEYIKIS